jgi:hypothetical protein
MATVHRPAPLPPRPGQAQAAPQAAVKKPLPAGAVAWSRTYLDDRNRPMVADHQVPVDADQRRTPHVRHTCRGHIEVNGVKQDCDSVAWLLPGEKGRFCPDHGCPLTPAEKAKGEPLLPYAAMWRAVEPSARPLGVLLAEFAAGIGEHAGHVPWWQPLAAAPLLVGGAYATTKTYLTKRGVKRGRLEHGQTDGRRVDTVGRRARTAAYTGTAAGGWLTLAAATDPHTPVGKVAWCSLPLWYALTAPTWWRYLGDLRNRPEPQPEPIPPARTAVELKPSADEMSAAEASATWASEVGIAGTQLDPATWQRIACGWQAVIVATKRGALGQLGGDNMKATVRRIAAAFDVPKSAVTWIEEHEDSPNRALLLIQPDNPLRDGQMWAGPKSIRIGKTRVEAEVGRFIDGTAMTEVLYRFGQGASSALTLGTTGSGKSERLRKKLIIERWTSFMDPQTGQRRGLFLSFLHDPKRLESFAEFRNAVHGYGTTRDDAHMMIDAFLRECFRRYDYISSLKWEDSKGRPRVGSVKWNPLVHGAILSAIWDEFHELAGDAEFAKKQEKLARYQRACGMRSEIASHMATLGDTASQALRDMLAGGRSTLLRTTSGLNASLATGGQLTADPRGLPKVPGMCLVADGETATLMGRESYIPADEDAERLGERSLYDWLFDDDNNPVGYPAEIPPETAEAFGREFMEWMAAGRREGGRDEAPSRAGRQRAATVDAANSLDALRKILFAATGPVGRAQIAGHPLWQWGGVTSTTLGNALRRGQDEGWLRKVTRGNGVEYEMTETERERIQAARDEQDEAAA